MAMTKRPRPRQSIGSRGARKRLRGSRNHPSEKAIKPTGMLTTNSSLHPPRTSRRPPTAGPRERPSACAAAWMPMPRPNFSRGSAWTMSATLLAWSMAAPKP
jgi:hypothetical protein